MLVPWRRNSNARGGLSIDFCSPSQWLAFLGILTSSTEPTVFDLDSSFRVLSQPLTTEAKFQPLPRSWNPRSES